MPRLPVPPSSRTATTEGSGCAAKNAIIPRNHARRLSTPGIIRIEMTRNATGNTMRARAKAGLTTRGDIAPSASVARAPIAIPSQRHRPEATPALHEVGRVKYATHPMNMAQGAKPSCRLVTAATVAPTAAIAVKPLDTPVISAASFITASSHHAAIGTQCLPIDPATIRTSQERHRISDIFRRRKALERIQLRQLLDLLIGLAVKE